MTNDNNKIETKDIAINSVVYAILNMLDGKIYIGSTIDMKERWKTHYNELQRNDHINPHLQNAWNKYGKDVFQFIIVEVVTPILEEELAKTLLIKEQAYLDVYWDNCRECYNVNKKAESPAGRKASEETKQKMSDKRRGEKHHFALLTDKQVEEIKEMLADGKYKLIEIAKMFGLKHSMISHIKNGHTYAHIKIDREIPKSHQNGDHNPSAKLKTDDVLIIKKMIKEQKKCADIAKMFNMTYASILGIKNGKTWKHIQLPQEDDDMNIEVIPNTPTISTT